MTTTLYRKKPVVVEAEQWFAGNPPLSGMFCCKNDGFYYIATLEGSTRVEDGDWIITGLKGEKHSCKPDIFAETYEPVNAT